MKLWDKGYTLDTLVEKFTIGNDRELDLELAIYDVEASRAHAQMLHHIGILSSDEFSDIVHVLTALKEEIASGAL